MVPHQGRQNVPPFSPLCSRNAPPDRGFFRIIVRGAAGIAGLDYAPGRLGLRGRLSRRPVSVDAGPTEKGKGQKFRSADGAYEFAAYTLANAEKDSPARYLRKNLIVPPQSLIYRRVTEQFFVMSSIREGRIFYSRCNFSLGIHCIFLEYPTAEKRAFDSIVTRVSGSLRPR